MIELLGLKTSTLNLSIEKLIGSLLFAEFSTTIVYVDTNGNPIIKEWVDCSDDGEIDRYFYYKTSKHYLKNFINGHFSQQDLIINSTDGFLYFQDVRGTEIISNLVLSSSHLPNQYKPSSNFYLNESDGVDTNTIYNFFNLDDSTLIIPVWDSIKEISISKKTETLNLHLHHGKGVGFGTINTDLLGRTLIKFDKLYKDIALDFFIGKNRGDVPLTPKRKEELNPFISTEIYGNIAASYSVLLRPKASNYNLFNNTSDTETIAKKVFSLISNSNQLELLQNEYILHSDFTISSYKVFLKDIYESQLKIELNWFSPTTTNEFNEELDYRSANKILDNIDNLNVLSEDDFVKKGKFRAINCDTGHFTFISTEEEQFTGYFDKLIKDGSEQITFIALFDIKIKRKIIKEPGRADAKIIDTIIAFFKED